MSVDDRKGVHIWGLGTIGRPSFWCVSVTGESANGVGFIHGS